MSDRDQEYSRGYLRYALALLVVVYTFNFVDRQILVILQESIKKEMGLSDGQLGLLTGFTFACFYATLGLPIARLADRGVRRNVIAWSVGLWSAMTAISGLVTSFPQLLLARMGVGVGEAGGSPPAHAIISDYYPSKARGRALGIYSMGAYCGVLVGFVAGGWLNQAYGWRVALIAIGLPGLLVAALVRFTIREPRRGRLDGPAAAGVQPLPLGSAIAKLWAVKSFRFLAIGAGLNAFVTYGAGNFAPSFLSRTYQLSPGTIGTALGLVVGIGGMVGTFLGGFLGDRLGHKDKRWYLWVPALAMAIAAPLRIASYYTGRADLTILLGGMSDMLALTYLGPAIAMTHALVTPQLRAFASSVLFLVLNLIGLGLGPLLTGVMSDRFGAAMGQGGLRPALVITTLAWLPGALAFALAARTLRADIADNAT